MPPTILLRFRDTDPAVDTIGEHRKILQLKSEVWWGWWKKTFEPDSLAGELHSNDAKWVVYLVDTSTARVFRCQCGTIRTKLPTRELSKVPSYYRAEKGRVHAWFAFSSIKECSADYKHLPELGQPTLYLIQRGRKPWTIVSPSKSRDAIAEPDESIDQRYAPAIVHISDLHYGTDHAFLPPGREPGPGDPAHLSAAIANDAMRLNNSRASDEPPIICITGDLTTKGNWSNNTSQEATSGVVELARRFKLEARHLVLIPGNHDMERYRDGDVEVSDPSTVGNPAMDYKHESSFRLFRQRATGEDAFASLSTFRRFVTSQGFEVHVAALNSCRITATRFSEYGWIGPDETARVLENFRAFAHVQAFRVLALHHHVVPVADVMRPEANGVTLTLDAGPLLKAAQSVGVQLVLHGHQHLPQMSKYSCAYLADGKWRGLSGEDVFVAGAGSAGSKSLPDGALNSYTYVGLSRRSVKVRFRQLRRDGAEAAELACFTLPIRPSIAPKGSR